MNTSPIATEAPKAGLSPKYTFVSSSDIIDDMENAGFFLSSHSVAKVRSEDNRPYAKHMMRFRMPIPLTTRAKDLPEEAPEIIVVNSHNGRSSVRVMLGFYRFACANGLFVGNSYSIRTIPHSASDAVSRVSMAANELMEQAGEIQQRIALWKTLTLTGHDKLDLAKTAAKLLGNGAVGGDLLSAVRMEDMGDDLWTVFNVIQENVMRGRGTRIDAKGRVRKLRGIKALKRIEEINRALWENAQDIADLLTGSGEHAEETMADYGF